MTLFIVLCLLLSSCGPKKADTLRICLDIGNQFDMSEGVSSQESGAKGLVDFLRAEALLQKRDLGEIEIEAIPSSKENSSEREAMLQRLRTEIMTGEGPDVFICCTEGEDAAQLSSSRLFPYLPKSVADGMFLPLDSYIDEFQLVSRDQLVEPVLEGGKDSQGQQVIVPLCYSIPCMVWEREAVNAEDYADKTWQDVLSSEDPVLSEQLRWMWPIFTFPSDTTRRDYHGSGLSYIYPSLLDYENKKVGMSEEDVTQLFRASIHSLQQTNAQETQSPNWALQFSRFLSSGLFLTPELPPENTELAVVPLRNQEGGATAVVSMYCAVNADTQYADDAAFVVECLLTEKCQSGRGVFQIQNSFAVPSMLINKNARAEGDTALTAGTMESWAAACEQINRIYFPSPADTELNNMLEEIQRVMRDNYRPDAALYEFVLGDIPEERLREIVHEYYGRISRLLEES